MELELDHGRWKVVISEDVWLWGIVTEDQRV